MVYSAYESAKRSHVFTMVEADTGDIYYLQAATDADLHGWLTNICIAAAVCEVMTNMTLPDSVQRILYSQYTYIKFHDFSVTIGFSQRFL